MSSPKYGEVSSRKEKKRIQCVFCGKFQKIKNVISLSMVPDAVLEKLRRHYPMMTTSNHICHADLESFHSRYMSEIIENDTLQYSNLQDEVLQSFQEHAHLEENLNLLFERKWTFGERVSDLIARFGGSWKFIISFGSFIMLWVIINSFMEASWDPYPFILLNLCLSMLASVQVQYFLSLSLKKRLPLL
jgi:hypothetical protein